MSVRWMKFAGVLMGTALTQASSAAPVAFDGFESYAANSALNAGNAGTNSTGSNGEFGWTADWIGVAGVNVRSGFLGAGTQLAEVDDATASTTAATRTFTPQTGTVYFSVIFRGAAGLEASDFIHFYLANAAGNGNSGGIGLLSTTDNKLGARVGGTNGGTTVSSSIDALAGSSYLLVGKLSKTSGGNYNRIDLFVNPPDLNEPGTAAATQAADSGVATVSLLGLRTFQTDVGDKYQFDDVRIGTSFADVVPEPGSVGVLGAAGLMWLGRRRRAATSR